MFFFKKLFRNKKIDINSCDIKPYKNDIIMGSCSFFEKKTLKILNGNYKKYILIEFNGNIIGHINLKGEKNFLSYINFTNINKEIILVKGCVYSIKGHKKITENYITDFNKQNIYKIEGNLEVQFLKIANLGNFQKLDNFINNNTIKTGKYIN